MKRIFAFMLIVSAIIMTSCGGNTTEKIIKLSLEGKKYDNLYLRVSTIYSEDVLRIEGISTNGYDWTFVIPDSISEITWCYCIRHRNDTFMRENEENVHRIEFQTIIDSDTLKSEMFNFDQNEKLIKLEGKFESTTSWDNTYYWEERDTTIVIQTILTDFFSLSSPLNKFLTEALKTRLFGAFYDAKNPNKNYEEFLTDYAKLIKENPNSLYYISSLATWSHFYESKEDIENLYKLFSPDMQNSIWGIDVKKSFSPIVFDGIGDIVLQNPITKKNEKIILEPTKYTLLCISASWCGPCRKKIPLLKEIHEKTKENLNLVYLSVDDSSTIDDWNTLMKTENIKWRNLWLTDKKLKYDWKISSIPDYILVYPNGKVEKISLKDEKEIEELYSILSY